MMTYPESPADLYSGVVPAVPEPGPAAVDPEPEAAPEPAAAEPESAAAEPAEPFHPVVQGPNATHTVQEALDWILDKIGR